MLSKLEELKVALAACYKSYQDMKDLIQFRQAYLVDPVAAVNTGGSVNGLDPEVLTYVEVFNEPSNLELAREDCLVLINNSLVVLLDKLAMEESKLVAGINAIISENERKINSVTSDPRLTVITAAAVKATKYLPYAELFEKRLESNMNTVMANREVSIPTYITWLYGIFKDLEEDNIVEILDSSLYKEISAYITSDYSVLSQKSAKKAIREIDEAKDELLAGTDSINKATVTPDFQTSGLAVISALLDIITNSIKAMSKHTHSFTFKEHTGTAELKKDVTELSKDITSNPDSLTNNITKYGEYLDRLMIASSRVSNKEIIVYLEISKYEDTQSIIAGGVVPNA